MFPKIKRKSEKDIKYPAVAEIKLDGELVMWDGYAGKLINSYGNEKYVDKSKLPTECRLWGELFYGTGTNFYSEYQSHQKSKDLKVVFFDLLNIGKECLYPKQPYKVRRMMLEEVTDLHIPSIAVEPGDISVLLDKTVAKGYEGLVVKPVMSYSFESWVKLKRKATCKLYITGIRKKTSGYYKRGESKHSLAVGTPEHRYGCVSFIGWENLILPLIGGKGFTGEDKDYWYIKPEVKLEIEYQMLTPNNHLRNPFIKRILDPREEIQLPERGK